MAIWRAWSRLKVREPVARCYGRGRRFLSGKLAYAVCCPLPGGVAPRICFAQRMTVQLAQMSHLPGDTAEALVVRDGGVGEELEVQLVCRAPWLDDQRDVAQPWETGTEALLTERVIAAARPSGAEAAGAESRVQLAIPVGAPPTAEGAISWSVRARMGPRAAATAGRIVRALRGYVVDYL